MSETRDNNASHVGSILEEHASLNPSSSDQTKSARVLHKFVAGVLNGAYTIADLSNHVKPADVRCFEWQLSTADLSFDSVCDALATAICIDVVPQQGVDVLIGLLSKPASRHLSARLVEMLRKSDNTVEMNGTLPDVKKKYGVPSQLPTAKKMREVVTFAATQKVPKLTRAEITQCVSAPCYGQSLCNNRCSTSKICIFDRVAEIARARTKETDIISKLWSLPQEGPRHRTWLDLPVNLCPRKERSVFHCISDIYDYTDTETGSLIVDFANANVGGGCFSSGFVQEEQMVAQSVDFAVRLQKHRQKLSESQAISYEGVHIDAWWRRDDAAEKEWLNIDHIQPCNSNPLTILAIDAPMMRHAESYKSQHVEWLARKISFIMSVAHELQSPRIFSGLLGGGAFRNNRPLVLLLHLLLHDDSVPLLFHHPIFASFGSESTHVLEQRLLQYADAMLDTLRARRVSTLREALAHLLNMKLPLSNYDADLADMSASTMATRTQSPKRLVQSVGSSVKSAAKWVKKKSK
jgi:hypothetical protein